MRLKKAGKKNIRNFGFGSRDPSKAALNACKIHYNSYSTAAQVAERFSQLLNWSTQTENPIKDLREINLDMFQAYARNLENLVHDDEIAVSTCHDYISAINCVMRIVRKDRHIFISTKSDTLIPKRNYISVLDKSESIDAKTIDSLSDERVIAICRLLYWLGLRFEEGAKCNPQNLLEQAITRGEILITDGTKGGRKRSVPITDIEQIKALKFAANIQLDHWSLIPKNTKYKQYRDKLYRDLSIPFRFHSLRHRYAQTRYEQLTRVKCPVSAHVKHGTAHITYIAKDLSISTEAARQIDSEARITISRELGHNRELITNTYLG